jgi:kynurenine formamidase
MPFDGVTTSSGDGRVPPNQADVESWMRTLSNWGRWGSDDELGTLNLVTPDLQIAATKLVRDGISVSMARDILTSRIPEHSHFGTPQRFMVRTGESQIEGQREIAGAYEYLGFVYHGNHVTHLDALSHMFFDGKMYNGYSARQVTATDGAVRLPVTGIANGVMTRGVLLDIPRLRGVEWLEAGDGVFPDEIEAAERAQGVEIGVGDVVFLRTGYGAYRSADVAAEHCAVSRYGCPGWHAACLPWFHERGVAMLGADVAQDPQPSGYERPVLLPIHAVGIVAMGLWLIDNADLEQVAATSARLGRWEFLFTLAPLRYSGATGSPVNPIATF